MRVTLATHGGLAAALNRRLPPRVVDVDKPGEIAELRKLINEAEREGESAAGATSDAMTYTVTVTDGNRETVIKRSDVDMTEAFAALLDFVERRS
ncbi:protealysin inhibitor emfourin [Actinoplanes sp. CA-030573]|uniref:protealysin inhibitor emfourin n=1 Tax=Actinoplanes sp. CA-030573 TaxID=3239898 RepID=UPI003D950474